MVNLEDIRREYEHPPLMEEEMDENPVVQFQEWMDLAIKYYKSDSNAMILSTVSGSGQPSSRTVLLKNVTKAGFVFYTNYNSRKGNEILLNPHVALLFYWPGLDRQIRIEGKAEKVGSEISDKYFNSRPEGSKKSAIVSPQSEEIEDFLAFKEKWEFLVDKENLERPENWGGYEVFPDYFEFWQGRKNRFHDRIAYKKIDKHEFKFQKVRLAP
ncbi:pyridoxamine 5'-phosphate oxidase [Membranihabitans maritimus]|uniref:pyridoxamine 5'-phosphate oxidase n=1 Tax=Membranihabitans maritimus TaxID=2904244 RepID=UPI001F0050F7|nr:pyridoxamine 5'-phosphate oxidase [Membranihabitans maritimus]